MKFLLRGTAALLVGLGLYMTSMPAQPQPKKKKILAIGETRGFHHDATSDGLALVHDLGKKTGLWDTYIQTSCEFITKKKLTGNKKNLDYYDAVFFYTTGELQMDAEQKASLMSFIKDEGKGFIGMHSALDTFYEWPEYGEMIGGYFDSHPWNTFDAPVIVEDRSHPAMAHFPKAFVIYDEIYQAKLFSRDKVRVLARLDETKIDLKAKNVKRTDGDFAVAWVKNYGNGRVFYSTFGHHEQALNRPDIQTMYTEAIKWALKLTEGDATPRPRPAK
ncbi:ThuA domain-containing protein [Bryobacter aggregatus]|uniref:ThuA domain-containing protein n=1 Tax=Bryobacter aggregatus TaxID=360054 RepID=UPI0004E12B45|nr:ThuA domain-containing protein [Bryobacter aggregatus]